MGLRDRLTLVRQFGLPWVVARGAYEFGLRSGLLERRYPTASDPLAALGREIGMSRERTAEWVAHGPRRALFAGVSTGRLPQVTEAAAAIGDGEQVLSGWIRLFGSAPHYVGNPPDWLRSPLAGAAWPADRHWTQIEDLGNECGDIKWVYELSRFGHVFALARADAASSDPRWGEAFWRHVASWMACSPPELGPLYHDGQEMALRTLAWVFGEQVFAAATDRASDWRAALVALIWWHCRHIERIHWVAARCMRNNHALSEAVALFTVGTVFPFLPGAARWRHRGLRWLSEELSWQVYDDGSYVQHSTNYARVVASLIAWAAAVAAASAERLPAPVTDAGSRLLTYLVSLQEESTGRLPNYGSNDGAWLFPLSSCAFDDYRPALVALAAACGLPSPCAPGPWDEQVAWTFGTAPSAIPRIAPERRTRFDLGGYYVLRGTGTRGTIRCARYRHRPSQADMLHLDLWFGGRNVCVDAGTYSYNAGAWTEHFASTAVHNTVTVNGQDQMRRGARFVWLDWVRGELDHMEHAGETALFRGSHDGYRPVTHRRTVLLDGSIWWVLDEMLGSTLEHACRLHWLVSNGRIDECDGSVTWCSDTDDGSAIRMQVRCSAPHVLSIVTGQEDPPRGWVSWRYGQREPVWSVAAEARGANVSFATVVGPRADMLVCPGGSFDDVRSVIARRAETLFGEEM